MAPLNVQRVGYRRVSTADQSNARQLDGLTFDKIFEDKASGKDTLRPGLEKLRNHVRDGDTVVVHSMDRLARNLKDLLSLVEELTQKGVKIQFIKENLVFTGEDSPISRLLLSVMGAVANFEREMILERQREGIAIAKAKGVFKGRRPALTAAQVNELNSRLEQAKLLGKTQAEVAREFRISRETLRKYTSKKH